MHSGSVNLFHSRNIEMLANVDIVRAEIKQVTYTLCGEYEILQDMSGESNIVFHCRSAKGKLVYVKIPRTRDRHEYLINCRIADNTYFPYMHRCVLPIRSFLREGYPVLVYPDMGYNLHQQFTTPPTTETIYDIVRQLTLILHDVHRAGIIYIDLKVTNVLYTAGKVYLIDFDTAVMSQEIGLPYWKRYQHRSFDCDTYTAPETCCPPGQCDVGIIDVSVDWWGVGHVIYQLVTRKFSIRQAIANEFAEIQDAKLRKLCQILLAPRESRGTHFDILQILDKNEL